MHDGIFCAMCMNILCGEIVNCGERALKASLMTPLTSSDVSFKDVLLSSVLPSKMLFLTYQTMEHVQSTPVKDVMMGRFVGSAL